MFIFSCLRLELYIINSYTNIIFLHVKRKTGFSAENDSLVLIGLNLRAHV